MRCYDFLPDELVSYIGEFLPNAKKEYEEVVKEVDHTTMVWLSREPVALWIMDNVQLEWSPNSVLDNVWVDPFKHSWYLDLPTKYYRDEFVLNVHRLRIDIPQWCVYCQGLRRVREPDHSFILVRTEHPLTTWDVIYALKDCLLSFCHHRRLTGFKVVKGELLIELR
jgi:hypothetical protein